MTTNMMADQSTYFTENSSYFDPKTPHAMESAQSKPIYQQYPSLPNNWDQDSYQQYQAIPIPQVEKSVQPEKYVNIPLQNSVQVSSIITEERVRSLILNLERVQTSQISMRQNVDKLSKSMTQMGNGFIIVTLLSWVFYWFIS